MLDIEDVRELLKIHEGPTFCNIPIAEKFALEELLEYKETGLTPDKIREMDKLYLEKCQEVNSLVAACEKLEGRKQYESK